MSKETLQNRIYELEDKLRLRDEQIKHMRETETRHHELMTEMREWLEDQNALIESWIDVFGMEQGESGAWQFDASQSKLWTDHLDLHNEHMALVRQWNKFVGQFNATVMQRDVGRPLAASEAQCEQVRKMRKAGASLRAIVSETSLSIRTVRTILDKDAGNDPASKRTKVLRRKELNRQRAAAFRTRKARRDAIPKSVTELRARAADLIKAAKGLGK